MVLQGQLALVTGISASWIGKHPSGAALMGSEGEALSSPTGRLAMVEAELEERKGDGWAVPEGARLWFPEMITLLHFRLISEPVPSFPTTRSCICCWKILHQFWLVASCSLRASFPLLHSNLIAGKEAQEKLSTNRGHCPQSSPLFRAPSHKSEIASRSSWNLINFVLTVNWIWNCERQGLKSPAQFKRVFPAFVIRIWKASMVSLFWL